MSSYVTAVGAQCLLVTVPLALRSTPQVRTTSSYCSLPAAANEPPGVPQVAHHFGVSQTAALVPLSVYVLGLGLGPIISAPLSETYGRRAVYLIFFPPSLLMTLGAGLSNSFASFVVCRLLAGALGSGCLAVGAGTNGDMFDELQRAISSALFLAAPFLGPAIGR